MPKTPTTYSVTRARRTRETLEHLAAQLAVLQEEVVKVRDDLPPEPRARGTADVTADARRATGQIEALQRPAGRARRDTEERRRHPSPIEDGIAPDDLFDMVAALVTDRPLTLQELVEATGVRQNRISGALVHLDRQHPGKLMRFPMPGAPGRRFRWFLAPTATPQR